MYVHQDIHIICDSTVDFIMFLVHDCLSWKKNIRSANGGSLAFKDTGLGRRGDYRSLRQLTYPARPIQTIY